MSEKPPPSQGKGDKNRSTKKYQENYNDIFRNNKLKIIDSIIYNGENYNEINKFLGIENNPHRLPFYEIQLPYIRKEYIAFCNPPLEKGNTIFKYSNGTYKQVLIKFASKEQAMSAAQSINAEYKEVFRKLGNE